MAPRTSSAIRNGNRIVKGLSAPTRGTAETEAVHDRDLSLSLRLRFGIASGESRLLSLPLPLPLDQSISPRKLSPRA
jgi:hypothetical protein